MIKRIGNDSSIDRHGKRSAFKRDFPGKPSVEARITGIIDSMSLTTGDKNKLKSIFTGSPGQPGIIDALFTLDR